MKQRFTVELERTVVKTATVEVVAEDLKDARDKALIRGRSSYIWTVAEGTTRVLTITAPANEATVSPVEPPPYGSAEMWRLARKQRRSK